VYGHRGREDCVGKEAHKEERNGGKGAVLSAKKKGRENSIGTRQREEGKETLVRTKRKEERRIVRAKRKK
jgi:hypothetical protein